MTRKLTFEQAAVSTKARGYELIKYAGSSNAYGSIFKCPCGNTWSTKLNNVVSSNKTGCPVCAKNAARMDEASIRSALLENQAELVSIDSEIKGQRTQVTVLCPTGHVRSAKLATIIYAKKGCSECAKRDRGVDLEGLNERLGERGYTIVDWDNSARKKGTFLCKCGGTWQTRVNSVLHGQSNCPVCYEGGLRGNEPAVFYIYELRKNGRLRYGYGISGDFQRRDAEHKRNANEAGWRIKLLHSFNFETGVDAIEREKRAKALLKAPKGMFPGFKTEAVMPKDLSKLLALL